MTDTKILRLPHREDAKALFPYVYRTSVVQHIGWDGPESEQAYLSAWDGIVLRATTGQRHFFVIMHPESRLPIGSCDVRPDEARFRGTVGLWIGEAHQGQGIGTRVVAELVTYAFEVLELHKLDAELFVDNWASRRAFEKNGFVLEGTIRGGALKFEIPRDEWHLGLVNPSSRFSPRA